MINYWTKSRTLNGTPNLIWSQDFGRLKCILTLLAGLHFLVQKDISNGSCHFGLKVAPQIFQRKIDNIFRRISHFTCIYIDDILVFSKTKEEHYSNLHIIFNLFEKHGLIVSRKKMKIASTHIDFLGTEIRQGKIYLQSYLSSKILDFSEKMEDIKTLRSFLGILNYARPYLKHIGKISGPL